MCERERKRERARGFLNMIEMDVFNLYMKATKSHAPPIAYCMSKNSSNVNTVEHRFFKFIGEFFYVQGSHVGTIFLSLGP